MYHEEAACTIVFAFLVFFFFFLIKSKSAGCVITLHLHSEDVVSLLAYGFSCIGKLFAVLFWDAHVDKQGLNSKHESNNSLLPASYQLF